MLDADLAALYGVPTKVLVQAVKRNRERFPPDFMFQLTLAESMRLRSQIVTSNRRGGRRYAPYAFTEQGIAMLSSVLRSTVEKRLPAGDRRRPRRRQGSRVLPAKRRASRSWEPWPPVTRITV
jgi:hypothetical protein